MSLSRYITEYVIIFDKRYCYFYIDCCGSTSELFLEPFVLYIVYLNDRHAVLLPYLKWWMKFIGNYFHILLGNIKKFYLHNLLTCWKIWHMNRISSINYHFQTFNCCRYYFYLDIEHFTRVVECPLFN